MEFKSLTIESKSAEIKTYSTLSVRDGQSVAVPGEQLSDLSRYEIEFEFTDSFT
ncbi:hypothetical protein [Maribacter sp. ACAM166]|uniref:hypothetical protein n=1 Tax=Maribacter sp. ACAM166 TaxID=2508996 RepID=UPI001484D706|nr:hypothetical protein [Maribacter sp. ACAM166]